jgi:hypothetical protein
VFKGLEGQRWEGHVNPYWAEKEKQGGLLTKIESRQLVILGTKMRVSWMGRFEIVSPCGRDTSVYVLHVL